MAAPLEQTLDLAELRRILDESPSADSDAYERAKRFFISLQPERVVIHSNFHAPPLRPPLGFSTKLSKAAPAAYPAFDYDFGLGWSAVQIDLPDGFIPRSVPIRMRILFSIPQVEGALPDLLGDFDDLRRGGWTPILTGKDCTIGLYSLIKPGRPPITSHYVVCRSGTHPSVLRRYRQELFVRCAKNGVSAAGAAAGTAAADAAALFTNKQAAELASRLRVLGEENRQRLIALFLAAILGPNPARLPRRNQGVRYQPYEEASLPPPFASGGSTALDEEVGAFVRQLTEIDSFTLSSAHRFPPSAPGMQAVVLPGLPLGAYLERLGARIREFYNNGRVVQRAEGRETFMPVFQCWVHNLAEIESASSFLNLHIGATPVEGASAVPIFTGFDRELTILAPRFVSLAEAKQNSRANAIPSEHVRVRLDPAEGGAVSPSIPQSVTVPERLSAAFLFAPNVADWTPALRRQLAALTPTLFFADSLGNFSLTEGNTAVEDRLAQPFFDEDVYQLHGAGTVLPPIASCVRLQPLTALIGAEAFRV